MGCWQLMVQGERLGLPVSVGIRAGLALPTLAAISFRPDCWQRTRCLSLSLACPSDCTWASKDRPCGQGSRGRPGMQCCGHSPPCAMAAVTQHGDYDPHPSWVGTGWARVSQQPWAPPLQPGPAQGTQLLQATTPPAGVSAAGHTPRPSPCVPTGGALSVCTKGHEGAHLWAGSTGQLASDAKSCPHLPRDPRLCPCPAPPPPPGQDAV